ncbi:unnamed protein product, partial [Dicrocoelium dendriticum]
MLLLSVCFDHRCFWSIPVVRWQHHTSNADVRRRIFGRINCWRLNGIISLRRLQWLEHVRMPAHPLACRALFALTEVGWKRKQGGQHMTWARSMKELTSVLGVVWRCRLRRWGMRDQKHAWLETLSDI